MTNVTADTTSSLLHRFKNAVAANDLRDVFLGFEQTPVAERDGEIVVIIAVKEQSGADSFSQNGRRFLPVKSVFTVTALAKPDVPYEKLLDFFENTVLERLLAAAPFARFQTKPLEHDRKLNRLRLTSEFTLGACLEVTDNV